MHGHPTGAPSDRNPPRHRPRRRRSRRLALAGVAFIALLLLTGAVYQWRSERRDLADHPAPGTLVDVGGHRLHLHCIGRGSPTVLLEAGLGNDVNHWGPAQRAIAATTRVCAYDRAGLGWSDPGPLPRDSRRIVAELGQLLSRANEPPPYVLVGHSNGGAYARLFAAEYPRRTAGLVLVDPNAGDADDCEALPASTHALYGTLVALAPFGVPRLALPALFPLERSALPPAARGAHGALRARTGALRALWSEWRQTCGMLKAVRDAGVPAAGLPVVVLTAGDRPPGPVDVTARHRALARELSAREFVVVRDSGHWIPLQQPRAVADAVRDVVDAARARRAP